MTVVGRWEGEWWEREIDKKRIDLGGLFSSARVQIFILCFSFYNLTKPFGNRNGRSTFRAHHVGCCYVFRWHRQTSRDLA